MVVDPWNFFYPQLQSLPPLVDSGGQPSENSFRKEQDSGYALASQRSPERQSQPQKWSRAFFITVQHLREAASGLRLK